MAYVNLGQVIYPVGAIYASANSTSPASLFGGNWTQITNAALRGSTRVGYTGADTHTLTINEMPSHNHLDQSRVSWSDNMSGGMHMSYVSQSNFQTDKVIYTSNTGGGCCTLNRATLFQLLYVATHKLNLQEVM